MTAALAIATGIAALLAGILRLGFLASFISEPVIKGFIVGLALTIMIGQVPKLLGIEKGSGDFFEQALGRRRRTSGSIDGLTLAVGLASLAGVMGLKRFVPVVPGSLVIVLASIAAVALLEPRGPRRSTSSARSRPACRRWAGPTSAPTTSARSRRARSA